MDVKTRQATLGDRERIGRFLQLAYKDNAQYKYPERWNWEFAQNPFWGGEHLPIWLAEVNENIVGQVAGMIVPLQLGDERLQAAWGGDLIVLPEYRRQGIARLLLQALHEHLDTVLGVNVTEVNRKILTSQGFEEIDAVVQLYKRIRFTPQEALGVIDAKLGKGSLLSKIIKRLRLGWVAAAALSLRIRVRDAKRLRESAHDIRIERVERFGAEADQLWDRLAPYFPAIVRRDSTYLNWKFVEQPYMQYDSFVAKRAGEVCGFVVVRQGRPPEPNVGIIADVFVAPDDDSTLNALLMHATKHLARKGVEVIIAASSVPSYVAHFGQIGFVETDRRIAVINCWEAVKRSVANCRGGWVLSVGDGDWDQYPWSWLRSWYAPGE